MRLVLVGPPGAGKGTQAAYLSSRYHIPHISTGEMLREQIRKHTKIGQAANELISVGKLVPDALMLAMVKRRLERKDAIQGFILDGFPRSDPQAEALEGILARADRPLDAVVVVNLPDDAIVNRLTARRTCPHCGRSYHLLSNPPTKDLVCDDDHTPLEQREDDREEAIRTRLQVYHHQTAPVIEFYRRRNLLLEADGTRDIHTVQTDIQRSLEERQACTSR